MGGECSHHFTIPGTPFLSPLKVIYKAFCNLATGSFAWIGAEDAEIIYLNDFRWHPKIIAWADLLLALEGDTVHLSAPKNLSSHDVELQRDTPFFATSDAPIVLVKGGSIDHTNTQIMNVRWRFFHFLASNTRRGAARISALWSLFCPISPGKHCEWRYYLNYIQASSIVYISHTHYSPLKTHFSILFGTLVAISSSKVFQCHPFFALKC